MLPSRQCLVQERLCIFKQSLHLSKLHLLQQHGFTVEECGCWTALSAVNNPLQKSFSWSPQFPDVYRLLLKKRRCYSDKHGPLPRCCHQIWNESIFFFSLNIWYVFMSSDVNKIWFIRWAFYFYFHFKEPNFFTTVVSFHISVSIFTAFVFSLLPVSLWMNILTYKRQVKRNNIEMVT